LDIHTKEHCGEKVLTGTEREKPQKKKFRREGGTRREVLARKTNRAQKKKNLGKILWLKNV